MNIQLFKKGFMLFLLVLVCNMARAETPFSGLYVFGDSLTDNGNDYVVTGTMPNSFPIPPKARYYKGRFSNGPNSSDQLWKLMGHSSQVKPFTAIRPSDLKITGEEALNFAFGGSTSEILTSVLGQFSVPGLLGQVGIFNTIKPGNKVLKGSAALVWSGGNDYVNQYVTGVTTTNEQVTKNIEKAIKELYDSGIRNFIVPNLPDLGEVPIAYILASLTKNDQIPQLLSNQAVEHNYKLASMLQNLAATLPHAKFYSVDIYSRVKAIISPSDIVPGPAAGCLYNIPAPNPVVCSAVGFHKGTKLIYWDEIHPTTDVHGIFADAMLEAISQ